MLLESDNDAQALDVSLQNHLTVCNSMSTDQKCLICCSLYGSANDGLLLAKFIPVALCSMVSMADVLRVLAGDV